jgi:hypothetical protein
VFNESNLERRDAAVLWRAEEDKGKSVFVLRFEPGNCQMGTRKVAYLTVFRTDQTVIICYVAPLYVSCLQRDWERTLQSVALLGFVRIVRVFLGKCFSGGDRDFLRPFRPCLLWVEVHA